MGSMVWFFTRGAHELKLETSKDPKTGEFLLKWPESDGHEKVERFRDAAGFRARLEVVEAELAGEQWSRRNPPLVLRDAWRL